MSVPIHRLKDLAETCVFTKQSPEPLYCHSLRLRMQDPSPKRIPLLPKLRGDFAEFLNEGSFERLRIFTPSTCVGLRYGHLINCFGSYFLAVWRQSLRPLRRSDSLTHLTQPEGRTTCLNAHIQSCDDLAFCVTPKIKTLIWWCRNILPCFPSSTPFGLDLGAD